MDKKLMIVLLIPLLLFSALPVHADKANEVGYQEESIYYVMVDRFNNGDTSNDSDVDHTNPLAYHGGDFQGIIDKLDYIKEMGFTSLLLTPIFNNGPDGFNGNAIENYREIEEHFGTLEVFKKLVNEAHEKDLKIIVDLGLRSAGVNFNETDMLDVASWWVQETNIDGYKLDLLEEFPTSFLANLVNEVKSEKENFLLIGQPYMSEQEAFAVVEEVGIDAIFNFSHAQGITSFSIPNQSFDIEGKDWNAGTLPLMVNYMDNPDTVRFTYLSAEENEHPAPRIKLALAYLYTAPGIPVVYYGTEIALNGAEPPANSALMDFRTDQELVEYITSLAEVRSSVTALTKGSFELIKNEDGLLIFKRKHEDQTVFVAINNTTSDQKFTLMRDQLDENKELKGLITEDTIRPTDDVFNLVIERDGAQVYLVQETTQINYSLFIAVFIVPILMIAFLYLNKRKHQNNNPKPE
ncbi:alpha-amylase family glycosyl hydrolase [Fredinandcohnia humi]